MKTRTVGHQCRSLCELALAGALSELHQPIKSLHGRVKSAEHGPKSPAVYHRVDAPPDSGEVFTLVKNTFEPGHHLVSLTERVKRDSVRDSIAMAVKVVDQGNSVSPSVARSG